MTRSRSTRSGRVSFALRTASSPLRAWVSTKSSLLNVNSTTFWMVTLSSATRIRAPIGSSWGKTTCPSFRDRNSPNRPAGSAPNHRFTRTPDTLGEQRDCLSRRKEFRHIEPHDGPTAGVGHPANEFRTNPEHARRRSQDPVGWKGEHPQHLIHHEPHARVWSSSRDDQNRRVCGARFRDAEPFPQIENGDVAPPVLNDA